MNIQHVLADLERDEGFRTYPYRDHLGYLTIGYGFLIDERLQAGIPKKVADYWLRERLGEAMTDLDILAPGWRLYPEPVQRGLLNMAYQLGRSRLSGFKKMLAALEARDYETASAEALDSEWAREQTPARANRIAEMFRSAT